MVNLTSSILGILSASMTPFKTYFTKKKVTDKRGGEKSLSRWEQDITAWSGTIKIPKVLFLYIL